MKLAILFFAFLCAGVSANSDSEENIHQPADVDHHHHHRYRPAVILINQNGNLFNLPYKSFYLINYSVPVAKIATTGEHEHPERVRRSPHSDLQAQSFMGQVIENGTRIVERITTRIKEKLGVGTSAVPGQQSQTFNSQLQ